MTPEDHKLTASHPTQPGSTEYRAKQPELIEQGKFDDAMQMDIDDMQSKFGNKYDEGILQAIDACPSGTDLCPK